MTSTSWFKLFGIGACVALAAAACTVSSGEGEDDEPTTGAGGFGGTGGDGGSGGDTSTTNTSTTSPTTSTSTTSNTTSTTGTSTTTGSGGAPEPVDCLDDMDGEIPGEVATCEPADTDSCCTKCVAANCCEPYSACFASEPFNICGGASDDESEIMWFINCMAMIQGDATPGTGEDTDFENCIAEATENVSAPLCEAGTISGPTNELAVCIHGDEDGIDGCFLECLTESFEQDDCIY